MEEVIITIGEEAEALLDKIGTSGSVEVSENDGECVGSGFEKNLS